jgi:hypothetical protein
MRKLEGVTRDVAWPGRQRALAVDRNLGAQSSEQAQKLGEGPYLERFRLQGWTRPIEHVRLLLVRGRAPIRYASCEKPVTGES